MSRPFQHPAMRVLLDQVAHVFNSTDAFLAVDRHLLFLCGGSEDTSLRKQFITYAEGALPSFRVFLAEAAASDVTDFGPPTFLNLSRFEQFIAAFSDCIVIFLESVGAFAEIGLFSHVPEITKKLLVVNDIRYQSTHSFVNYGPLAEVNKASILQPVLYLNTTIAPIDFTPIRERLSTIFRANRYRRHFTFASYDALSPPIARLAIVLEVKFLQRWVVSNIFNHAPVHPTATAYRRGANVRNNAILHAHSRFFLKLDFEDFFPSIQSHDVTSVLAQVSSTLPFALTTDDLNIVVKIVTRYGHLPIGAPSSPAISNAVMYRFDGAMLDLARQFSCIYSRYADDIVFSTNVPHVLGEVLREVRQYLAVHTLPALRINEGKVVFNSKKRRVRVTGLVIDCENKISVGRSEKRTIKALVHRFSTSRLDAEMATYLKGYLGYVKSVEPTFVNVLENKYGRSVIDAIFAATTVRRKK